MDPVSVFKALYDTRCLKFGRFDLKSGLVAPYYMNLRRLPLYPSLFEAVVAQIVEQFLAPPALASITAQLRRQQSLARLAGRLASSGLDSSDDADSQLEEEEEDGEGERGSASPANASSEPESDWEKLDEPAAHIDPIICGVPYGAVPLAAAVAYRARLPYLLERKEAKTYGDPQCLMAEFNQQTRSVLDGLQLGGSQQPAEPLGQHQEERPQRVILIEDVICSGVSILETVNNLAKRNLKVEFVICVVDREENGINLLLEQAGIRVLPLYSMSAILRVLETTGRIDTNQLLRAKKWMQDNQFEAIGMDPTQLIGAHSSSPPPKVA